MESNDLEERGDKRKVESNDLEGRSDQRKESEPVRLVDSNDLEGRSERENRNSGRDWWNRMTWNIMASKRENRNFGRDWWNRMDDLEGRGAGEKLKLWEGGGIK